MYDSYLIHHSIKGQQWGVRHGPPYPIDGTGDISIKQGTHFKRLSIYDESDAAGHAYVNYLKNDSRHYRGFFTARLKAQNMGRTVYSIDLEAAKDLRAPSKQKRLDTFIELYKNDPIIGKKLGAYHKSDNHYFTPLPRMFYEWKFSRLEKSNKLDSLGYRTFVRSIGGDEYTRNAYFNALAKKGYHFVTDDMDAGRFGKEPSIVFDRKSSTSYIGQTPVSTKEMLSIIKDEGVYMKSAKGSGGIY